MKYNNRELEYEETPMNKAFELMDKAYNESNEKKAIKYAKDALKICPECVDAELFIISSENSSIKQGELIDKILEKEKNRLIKENIYTDDNLGMRYMLIAIYSYLERE